jgi:hypothetical protein
MKLMSKKVENSTKRRRASMGLREIEGGFIRMFVKQAAPESLVSRGGRRWRRREL